MSQVAKVAELSGSAYVIRDGVRVNLETNAPLYEADVLNTEEGTLKIIFTDGSSVSIADNTELLISDYVYTDTDESFILDLVEGAMESISGNIVKRNPDAFKIETPKAVFGIRGTTTFHKVTAENELHAVLSITDNHTVVLTLPDQTSIVMSRNYEAVTIFSNGSYEAINLTSQEVQDINKLFDAEILDDIHELSNNLQKVLSEISLRSEVSSVNKQNLTDFSSKLLTLQENPSDFEIEISTEITTLEDGENDRDDDDSLEDTPLTTPSINDDDDDDDDDDSDDRDDDFLDNLADLDDLDDLADASKNDDDDDIALPPTTTIALNATSNAPVTFIVPGGGIATIGNFINNGATFQVTFDPALIQTRSLSVPADSAINLTNDGFTLNYQNINYQFYWNGAKPSEFNTATTAYNVLTNVNNYTYNPAGDTVTTADGSTYTTNFTYIQGTGIATLSTGDDTLILQDNGSYSIGGTKNIAGFTVYDAGTNKDTLTIDLEDNPLTITQDGLELGSVRFENFEVIDAGDSELEFNIDSSITSDITYEIRITNESRELTINENGKTTEIDNIDETSADYTYVTSNGVNVTFDFV